MSKVYTVIYTDFGDSCDGFARVLGTYDTKDKAEYHMKQDATDYRKDNGWPVNIDNDDRILIGDEAGGCQWQILEIETEV